MKRRSKWNLLTAGLALIAMTACASSGGAGKVTYHDPNMDFSLVKNVAVLPFANLTTNTNAGERVRDVFMTMLQATGALYVLAPGEVGRGISRSGIENPVAPSSEEIVTFAKIVNADVVVSGTVLEYGEVRSGAASANVISVSVEMLEVETGKVVWSASATEGGISGSDRLFGGGGEPMSVVTERAINDLLNKLFK